MGLRCIIGHEYGAPQTSRDRRQRGNEVVATVQEYRECARCGHRRIISENKEVTAEPPEEPAPTEEAPAAASSTESADPDDAAMSFAEPIDEPLSAEEDDGIILEDEPADAVRGYGEWPETDRDDVPTDPGVDHDPWPGEVTEEAGSPEPAAPPSDPFGAEPPRPSDVPARDGPESAPADAGTGAGRPAESTAETSTPTPPPDPHDAELVCPDCGESWPSVNASLRPGDICPECRGSYLQEHVVH